MRVGSSWVNNGGAFTVRRSTVIFNSTSGNPSITSRASPFFNVYFGTNTTGGFFTLVDSSPCLRPRSTLKTPWISGVRRDSL